MKSYETVTGPLYSENAEDVEKPNQFYNSKTSILRQMMEYMIKKNKVPEDILKTVLDMSGDWKACNNFLRHLLPTEVSCVECDSMLS